MRSLPRLPLDRPLSGARYSAVELSDAGDAVYLLDQRRLPGEVVYLEARSAAEVARAIRDMVVRGAPAIGVAAAYGVALARREGGLDAALDELASARPTAVNLRWAVARVGAVARRGSLEETREEARALHREDVAACRAMGALGAELLPPRARVLTHCNAGALATGGYGTALGVVRAAWASGRLSHVLADETRPYLQGARLTAWELHEDGVPVELLTDGMAGHFFARGEIDAVIVGADRIAASGDVANKIGTYGLAVLARAHEVPFYVAAPWSTVDLATARGAEIVIEERASDEVTVISGVRVAPEGVRARHPGFDVTPARLVTALVTERGVVRAPDAASLSALALTGARPT
ncbi:MAG: S-methyl-5-thioribose-1-phosphate isomerase [Polyangiaceae bacterium]|nr:S-methyl-5-thioribose-1-phosphate isomerase [Polyangiaceae bacterium]